MVDDEHVIADTLALILRSSGYEVGVAYDGRSALRQCEREVPDLILSDVVMPGMNGVELAIEVCERFPPARVLLFSGQAASFDLLESARRQGYHFELLAKPVHPKDLLAKISEDGKPKHPPVRRRCKLDHVA